MMFHIIQLVDEYHMKRSPGCRSSCRLRYFRCSSSTPPWPCTMPFGLPVVPDENITQSGCANGTGGDFQGGVRRDGLRPRHELRVAFEVQAEPRHHHGGPQRRHRLPDRGQLRPAIDALAAVQRAVGGDQHLRVNLAQPGYHAVDRHVLVAHRPDRAHARRGQRRDNGLADVGQVSDDTVAGFHPETPQVGRERGGFGAAVGPKTTRSSRLRRRLSVAGRSSVACRNISVA